MKIDNSKTLKLAQGIALCGLMVFTSCEKEDVMLQGESNEPTAVLAEVKGRGGMLNDRTSAQGFIPPIYWENRVAWSMSENFNFAPKYFRGGDSFTRIHAIVENDKDFHIILSERSLITESDTKHEITIEKMMVNTKEIDISHPSFKLEFSAPVNQKSNPTLSLLFSKTSGLVSGLVFKDGTPVERIDSYDVQVKYDVTYPATPITFPEATVLPEKSESVTFNLKGGADITSDVLSSRADITTDAIYNVVHLEDQSVVASIKDDGKVLEVLTTSPYERAYFSINSLSLNGKEFSLENRLSYHRPTSSQFERYKLKVENGVNSDGIPFRKFTYTDFVLNEDFPDIKDKITDFKLDLKYRFEDKPMKSNSNSLQGGGNRLGRVMDIQFALENQN